MDNSEIKNGDYVLIKNLSNNAFLFDRCIYIGLSKDEKHIIQDISNGNINILDEGFVILKVDKAKEESITQIRSIMHRTGISIEELTERCYDLK